jgi:hypothetical protein
MKHERFRELLVLSFYGELSNEDGTLLTGHLLQCSACREEREELKELHSMLKEEDSEIPEYLLWQARDQLFMRLRREKRDLASQLHWVRLLNPSNWNWLATGGAAAALCVGFLIGYLAFGLGVETELDPFGSDEVRITNLQLRETNGAVELTFDAARRFQLAGEMSDPDIQRFLAHALVNEQNAGTRLRAVNTIRSQTPMENDRFIQKALLAALKRDENPAVRQQALSALQKYTLDEEIRDTLVYVLMHDQNAKLRIEAINTLEMAHMAGQPLEEEVLGALQQRLNTDENKYIRLRAKAVLEEVEPQFF